MNQKWCGTSMVVAVILLLVIFLWAPAFAQGTSETEDTADRTIKIYVDGVLFIPPGDSSKTADPLLHDGNVYLPIGVLGEALGKPVEWDRAANSVYIGEPAEIAEITVGTAEELISALGSNRRILLKEGLYNLTAVDPGYVSSSVYFSERPDGYELFLDGVHNLTIEGTGNQRSEIVVEPRYANVMNFQNCSNISIVNIKAGHTEDGLCSGGVFLFDNCAGVQIDGTDMYGCGTLGIIFNKVMDAKVTGSTIYGCTWGIMSIQGSSNVLFKDCVFRDNSAYDIMISVMNTSDLTFDSCSFLRNKNASSLFYLSMCENITVENAEFIDNDVLDLAEPEVLSVDASSRFENNTFDGAR